MTTLRLVQPIGGLILILNRVLNYTEGKRTPIPKKNIFDRVPPTTEATAYADFPREHIIICRLNSTEKAYLYTMDFVRTTTRILENGDILASCWIDSIEVDYEIVEYVDSPWVVTINLVESRP